MADITINNIKNIKRLEFNIPKKKGVYLLTGVNGIGKSTLLSCIHRIGYGNAFRDNMKTSINGTIDEFKGNVTYTVNNKKVEYAYRKTRWTPKPKGNSKILKEFGFNNVMFFPPTGARLYVHNEELNVHKIRKADQWLIDAMNTIFLTEKFSELRTISIDAKARGVFANHRNNIAYLLKEGKVGNKNQYYSEKNFSFGEILILNLLIGLKSMQSNSLLLIDEFELALHPKVQISLYNFLKTISIEKNIVTIFSTHSVSLIKNCKNIIFLEYDVHGNIVVHENCFPARAIGEIAYQEDISPDAVFFVEDMMAKFYLQTKLNHFKKVTGVIPDVKIIPIGPFSSVVDFHNQAKGYVFSDNVKTISFLDADVKSESIPYYKKWEPTCSFLQSYNQIKNDVQFLSITPEVGLVKELEFDKTITTTWLKSTFENQSLDFI